MTKQNLRQKKTPSRISLLYEWKEQGSTSKPNASLLHEMCLGLAILMLYRGDIGLNKMVNAYLPEAETRRRSCSRFSRRHLSLQWSKFGFGWDGRLTKNTCTQQGITVTNKSKNITLCEWVGLCQAVREVRLRAEGCRFELQRLQLIYFLF
jgi:hypothetical protein